jgi:hypothetical protein
VDGQNEPVVGTVPPAVTLVTMPPASRVMVAMPGEDAVVVLVQVKPAFIVTAEPTMCCVIVVMLGSVPVKLA